MLSKVIFQSQSSIILLLIYVGLYYRKNRKKHVPIMLTAIIWDILLILQIELTRGAIEKASKVVTNPLLLNFHVSIAVGSVLCYFALIFTGNKLLKGNKNFIKFHKPVGLVAVTLRTLTYITSYFVASN